MLKRSNSPGFNHPPLPQYTAPARFGGAVNFGKNAADENDTVEIIMPEQYADRRSEPRTNCNERGALLLLKDYDIVECRILDQSLSGARVAFDAISRIPPEIWLIDLRSNMARRGTSAWCTSNRMGLKFNFAMSLIPGAPRPAKVPPKVYNAWLKLSGLDAKVDTKTADDDNKTNILYFD